jgi:hypothetical protein
MFSNYVKGALNHNDYMAKLRGAPEGQKYCNAWCQKYMPDANFYDGKANCKVCYNVIARAKERINANEITIEQFLENPLLVKREDVTIPVYKDCITCKENLSLDKFEAMRRECIACRRKKSKINHQKRCEKLLPAIEAVKGDTNAMMTLVRDIPSDALKLVMTHYKISGASRMTKDEMVVKVVNHFKSLLNPFICLGKCGRTLDTQFSTCNGCSKKPAKATPEEIMADFETKLDGICESLTQMKLAEGAKYNKKQVVKIAEKLGIKFYLSWDKSVIMSHIDTFLTKRNEEREKAESEALVSYKGDLNLNGILIESRDDGFINATQLCKAGGKMFNHYKDLKQTQEYIEALSLNTGIPVIKLMEVTAGRYGGAWIHPDLATHLAMWLSPTFSIQVSRWVRELAITGTVTVGREKTSNELIELRKNYKKLETNHRKLLEKKQYHKFNKGACFYIISDMDGKSVKFKPGFEGVDIDVRLAQHRSTMPACKLEYLVHSADADLIERNVLKRFESKRVFKNHEWIYDVDVSYIIKSTRTIMDVLSVEYKECEAESVRAYNEQIAFDGSISSAECEK